MTYDERQKIADKAEESLAQFLKMLDHVGLYAIFHVVNPKDDKGATSTVLSNMSDEQIADCTLTPEHLKGDRRMV